MIGLGPNAPTVNRRAAVAPSPAGAYGPQSGSVRCAMGLSNHHKEEPAISHRLKWCQTRPSLKCVVELPHGRWNFRCDLPSFATCETYTHAFTLGRRGTRPPVEGSHEVKQQGL